MVVEFVPLAAIIRLLTDIYFLVQENQYETPPYRRLAHRANIF